MKGPEPKGKRRVMAEINMIPLIDVALVLLIIFMIMTPLMVRTQIKITLPQSKSADQTSTRQQTVKVQVQKDGVIFINSEPVSREAIDAVLKKLVLDPANQPVVVEADKDVAFQHVVIVMDAAKRLGVVKLGVSVKLEESAQPAGK
jgi:biopolymer transport protein ExbD